MRFHDGTLIKAEDVLASFNYIRESRNIFKISLYGLKIEVKDEKTIIILLKNIFLNF